MDVVVEIAIVDDGVMPWQWCDQSGAKLYARQGRLLDDVPHLITCCTSLMTVKYLFFFSTKKTKKTVKGLQSRISLTSK